MPKNLLTLALTLVASTLASAAHAQSTFNVSRGRAVFRSEAQLETINGVTEQVTGSFAVDPQDLSSASGRITVQTSSFRTGIDLRDEHLRSESWLSATQHPTATLLITRVTGASALREGEDVGLTLHGRLTIRGQTRDVQATLRVRWDGGANIRARAQLALRLSDYGITINDAVRLKVSNEIRLTVDIRAAR